MNKSKIVVIFTCFNRREKTITCMRSLVEKNRNAEFCFIVVDDNSTDGTGAAIQELNYDVHYLMGTGSLYWAGGMRKGIGYFLNEPCFQNWDYVALVNDDVAFFDESLDKMVEQSRRIPDAAIVGNCCNHKGEPTYGATKFYKNKMRKIYYHLGIQNAHVCADSFNCNCVLFPAEMVRKLGNFDECYTHSFADYDYGVSVRRNGFGIYGTDFFVGACDKEGHDGAWQDPTLPMRVRLKKKEHPKGLPFREYYHFLRKNLGLGWALRYAFTPYIRILLKK